MIKPGDLYQVRSNHWFTSNPLENSAGHALPHSDGVFTPAELNGSIVEIISPVYQNVLYLAYHIALHRYATYNICDLISLNEQVPEAST